jgi:hypothetical protein
MLVMIKLITLRRLIKKTVMVNGVGSTSVSTEKLELLLLMLDMPTKNLLNSSMMSITSFLNTSDLKLVTKLTK